jgi:cytochrome c oxidase subunit 2
MLGLSAVAFAVVVSLLVLAVVRRARGRPEGRAGRVSDHRVIVLGGIVLPALLLIPTIAMTISASRAQAEDRGDALQIEVTGRQFWWDLRYPAPGANRIEGDASFRTANEIHIPVGRPVELRLRSEDVIHSFWVPPLGGKTDLIPGRTNTLRIQADEPGVYRGRCAEFCGTGHALMRIMVVAEPEERFQEWMAREAGPVAEMPDTGLRQELANSCGPCHDMRGVYASRGEVFRGDFGPDLTHLAARRMIGANLLPNTREALGRWIVDPQGIKPGNRMPDVGLDGATLGDVVDYLETLE